MEGLEGVVQERLGLRWKLRRLGRRSSREIQEKLDVEGNLRRGRRSSREIQEKLDLEGNLRLGRETRSGRKLGRLGRRSSRETRSGWKLGLT